jgi:Tfp pilus assembly protein PilO
MKRLPPNKRNQLIGVLIAAAVLICVVYFMLISPMKAKIDDTIADTNKETRKLEQYKAAINQMAETVTNLAVAQDKLNIAEADMASGDPYAWTYDTMRKFKADYHRVEITTIGQPAQSDCDLIGGFPYKQIRFSINGAAFYHDMGRFISDFENKFPHCRVANLIADPNGNGERLSFRMDVVALVKSNN